MIDDEPKPTPPASDPSNRAHRDSSSPTPVESLVIVALGDSTTDDLVWSDQIDEVYAQYLPIALAERGIQARVYNAGISGTTTREARLRLEHDVLRHLPDLVIIQFGINDSWVDIDEGRYSPRLTRDEYRENLRCLVRAIRTAGAQVVLMTPNPMRWSDPFYIDLFRKHPSLLDTHSERGINALLDLYAQDVRDVALEQGVPLVDVHLAFEEYGRTPGCSTHNLLVAGDGIHPNTLGQRLVCQLLTAQIAVIVK